MLHCTPFSDCVHVPMLDYTTLFHCITTPVLKTPAPPLFHCPNLLHVPRFPTVSLPRCHTASHFPTVAAPMLHSTKALSHCVILHCTPLPNCVAASVLMLHCIPLQNCIPVLWLSCIPLSCCVSAPTIS
jgi:hypothetical protein